MKAAILAAAATLLAVSAASAGEFTYAQDGFAITLPSQPTATTAMVNAGPSPIERHDYTLDMGNGARFVISATAIPGSEKADEAGTTRSAAEGAVKGGNGTNAIYSELMLGGHHGTAATFTANGKVVKNHYFLAGGRFFVLSAAAPANAAYPAAFDAALASFRLTQ